MVKKADYGSGHQIFMDYMNMITEHEAYKGMPDLYYEDKADIKRIQWEAPSNRQSGQFKDSYSKRLDWWRKKAREIGIDPDSPQWISRTAKQIHPTKQKPCKRCGRILDIRYCYPSAVLLKRISKLKYIGDDFELKPLEHIKDLVMRMYDKYGERMLKDASSLLKCAAMSDVPSFSNINELQNWLEETYIPSEPKMLSPGAMANPPDRLDGFHTLNQCCRGKADHGRRKENLLSYIADRRAFEHWVGGDWVVADKLMGMIRTNQDLKKVPCLNGHSGPCAADHIGPISLGFEHRPEFQFLCNSCNSAKNNRMYLSDVMHLREIESKGTKVISWYCKKLWDLRKNDVVCEETAKRLSKMLRDNRKIFMIVLYEIFKKGELAFLTTLLNLECAEYTVALDGVIVVDSKTFVGNIRKANKTTSYVSKQKTRRIRVAFHSLKRFAEKENRHSFDIDPDRMSKELKNLIVTLQSSPNEFKELNARLQEAMAGGLATEQLLRDISSELPKSDQLPETYIKAKLILSSLMDDLTVTLGELWQDDRYVRAELDEE